MQEKAWIFKTRTLENRRGVIQSALARGAGAPPVFCWDLR
jgi:hypothetical protein